MPAKASNRAVDVSVDAKEFIRVLGMAKEFDKKVYTKLRRQLRAAAKDAAADVKSEAVKAPSKGPVKYSRGLRQGIAGGVKLQIAASEKGRKVGVFVVSRGSEPRSKLLQRKWDSPKGWRHPVFARGSKPAAGGETPARATKWVTQTGRPYFGTVIEKRAPEIGKAVQKALDDAVEQVARGKQ